MQYTYMHISSVDKSVFYVGKGTNNRAYVKNNHNQQWHDIAKNGYEVEILAKWDTGNEACEHEKFLIQCAKDLKWPIVNLTSGGQGVSGSKHWCGKKHSEETRRKMSATKLGMKYRASVKTQLANSKTNNPSWKGFWITPDGSFDTCRDAAKHYNVDAKTIYARCKGYKEQLVSSVKHYPPKTGWSFQPK